MNKIIRNIGAGVAMCLMMVGCTTNFEEYNTNPYQPGKVPANSLLSTMFKVYASPQQIDCQAINCRLLRLTIGVKAEIFLLIIMRWKTITVLHGELFMVRFTRISFE